MEKAKKTTLEHPPLREVIFEVKWKRSLVSEEVKKNNQLIAGMFSAKVKDEYKYFEPLDASNFPLPEDDNFPGVPLFRFRKEKDGWPLIQIGSGLFSVNDTKKYEWADFKKRCSEGLYNFLELYDVTHIIETISLRYVNSIPFDYAKTDVIDFLNSKMEISLSLPESIFEISKIEKKPENFSLSFSFPSISPVGNLNFHAVSGKVDDIDSLVWDNSFITKKGSIPKDLSELDNWLDDSHEKLQEWFFTLIDKFRTDFEY